MYDYENEMDPVEIENGWIDYYVEMQKEEKALREYAEFQGKNYSPYRYITEFENVYPDIASKYYDMKWT